ACIKLSATLYTDFVNDLQEREKHERVAAEITQTGGQKHLHNLPGGVLPLVALSFNILFNELAHLFKLQWVDYRQIYMALVYQLFQFWQSSMVPFAACYDETVLRHK